MRGLKLGISIVFLAACVTACEDSGTAGNGTTDPGSRSIADALRVATNDGSIQFIDGNIPMLDSARPAVDAQVIERDLGPPVESCPQGQVPVGSRCEYLCFSDSDCALDEYCNAQTVCQPHPSCAEIMPCPDTCTGWCVQSEGDQCELGQTRCAQNTLIEECQANEDGGGNNWVLTRACATGERCEGGRCVQSGGPGGCQNECLVNQQRCAGEQVQQCAQAANGCTAWMAPMDCANGDVCANGWCGGEPPCSSNCAIVGSETCVGDQVSVCEEVEPGCQRYSAPRSCGADRICRGFGCSCIDECQIFENECVDDTTIRVCERVPDGCYQLGAPQACPVNQRCQNGRCNLLAGCLNDCVQAGEGATECSSPFSSRICVRDVNDCLNWSVPMACGAGERCEDGLCQDQSQNCMNQCEQENTTLCQDNSVYRCQRDAQGCLYLQQNQICGGNQMCQNGACVNMEPPPCEDQCMGPQCLDENTPQTCVVGGNGCRVLMRGAPCNFNTICVDGECVCDHQCDAIGETRCDGDWAQRCSVGGNACREWQNSSLCIGNQMCQDGACVDR